LARAPGISETTWDHRREPRRREEIEVEVIGGGKEGLGTWAGHQG